MFVFDCYSYMVREEIQLCAKGVFIHMHETKKYPVPSRGGHNSSKDFDGETTGVSGKSLHISIYKK